METAVNILLYLALGGVVFVLGWGLINMFRGGSGNLSQKLMRARVITQFVAIILLLLAVYFFGGRG